MRRRRSGNERGSLHLVDRGRGLRTSRHKGAHAFNILKGKDPPAAPVGMFLAKNLLGYGSPARAPKLAAPATSSLLTLPRIGPVLEEGVWGRNLLKVSPPRLRHQPLLLLAKTTPDQRDRNLGGRPPTHPSTNSSNLPGNHYHQTRLSTRVRLLPAWLSCDRGRN